VLSFLHSPQQRGTPVVSMGDVVARALVITFSASPALYLLDLFNFKLSQPGAKCCSRWRSRSVSYASASDCFRDAIPKFGVAGKMYYLSILIASFLLLLLAFRRRICYITRFAAQEIS